MNAKDGLANVHYVSRMTKMLKLTVIILANGPAHSIYVIVILPIY